jgi:hypothetical protein
MNSQMAFPTTQPCKGFGYAIGQLFRRDITNQPKTPGIRMSGQGTVVFPPREDVDGSMLQAVVAAEARDERRF